MTFTLDTHHDALALIPYLLGYYPRNAVVLCALDPTARDNAYYPIMKIGVCARVPAVIIDATLEFIDEFSPANLYLGWFGNSLADMVADRDSLDVLDTAALAAQRMFDAHERYPQSGYVNAALTDYSDWIAVRDACAQGTNGLTDLRASGVVASYRQLASSSAVVQCVFQGRAPQEDEPIAALPRREYDVRAPAVATWQETMRHLLHGGDNAGACRSLLWNMWKSALHRYVAMPGGDLGSLDTQAIGYLNAGLSEPEIRDYVILYAISDSHEHMNHGDMASQFDAVFDRRKHPSRHLAPAIELLDYVATWSADIDPAAYAVSGYLCWWIGQRRKAADCVRLACASDGSYRLARLVEQALQADIPGGGIRVCEL
ncbi:DUF4192 family protein [Trueperella sp. LYQ143]|uniref:DUF4192 family protein n=1 Tax=Trueperella sp. LYQ143 TaxID=3391059 RepID=UPI0039836D7A